MNAFSKDRSLDSWILTVSDHALVMAKHRGNLVPVVEVHAPIISAAMRAKSFLMGPPFSVRTASGALKKKKFLAKPDSLTLNLQPNRR